MDREYNLMEVIEQLRYNPNLRFVHADSKTELTKNILDLFEEGWEKQPVTFMEALENGTRFRVEHEILETKYPKDPPREDDIFLKAYIERFLNDDYLPLGGLMMALSRNISGDDLNEIIRTGNWYYK